MIGGSDDRLETPRGTITITVLAGNVHRVTVVGHLEEAHARRWIERVDPKLDTSDADACCDWFEMTGYDSSARKLLTDWALRRRDRTRSATFLVRPGIVAMGVSVASMALSITGLEAVSTSDRERFEAIVRERGAQARRSA